MFLCQATFLEVTTRTQMHLMFHMMIVENLDQMVQ